jgi:protein MPE1
VKQLLLGFPALPKMSSSIFFKFKSQKEPTRLPFDGTAISVFDAKRDIITINKLGDGTDFDLAVYNEESGEGGFIRR